MLNFCANISWLFNEYDFLDRITAASKAGFRAVEFHHTEGTDPVTVAKRVASEGMKIALFNCGVGDFLEGGPGISGVPGREQEFRLAVDQVCATGAVVGGDVGVQIGASRVPGGVSRQQCLDVYVKNLQYASDKLADVNCRVLIEPMNTVDFPDLLITDVATALDMIEKAGADNVFLQFDCYHEAMSGEDVELTIRRIYNRIRHVQFADAPNRGEPGTGTLNYGQIFKALEDVGYDKWVAAEYHPTGGGDESLNWFRTYQNNIS